MSCNLCPHNFPSFIPHTKQDIDFDNPAYWFLLGLKLQFKCMCRTCQSFVVRLLMKIDVSLILPIDPKTSYLLLNQDGIPSSVMNVG